MCLCDKNNWRQLCGNCAPRTGAFAYGRSPCIGRCSTSLGDDICKGCKRTAQEVIEWNGYTREQKVVIIERIRGYMKTNSGRDVRIICTDRKGYGGKCPVLGLIKDESGNEVAIPYSSDFICKQSQHFPGEDLTIEKRRGE